MPISFDFSRTEKETPEKHSVGGLIEESLVEEFSSTVKKLFNGRSLGRIISESLAQVVDDEQLVKKIPMPPKLKNFSTPLEPELASAVKSLSARSGRSITSIVRLSMVLFLDAAEAHMRAVDAKKGAERTTREIDEKTV